jgi:hypothetical protein
MCLGWRNEEYASLLVPSLLTLTLHAGRLAID